MADFEGLQKTAFLDTNVLHHIGLYLRHSKGQNLDPLNFSQTSTSIQELEDADLRKDLVQGCKIVELMLDRNLRVEYAAVSELELLIGRIKGKVALNAAREGVPDRMFSHIREEQIRRRVHPSQLADLKEGVDKLATVLEEPGFTVQKDDTGRTRDVLGLAFAINGLVYFEAMDSIIYASVLLSQADYLFTADNAFKKIVNQIHNPNGNAQFEQVNGKLRDLVAKLTLNIASKQESNGFCALACQNGFQNCLEIRGFFSFRYNIVPAAWQKVLVSKVRFGDCLGHYAGQAMGDFVVGGHAGFLQGFLQGNCYILWSSALTELAVMYSSKLLSNRFCWYATSTKEPPNSHMNLAKFFRPMVRNNLLAKS